MFVQEIITYQYDNQTVINKREETVSNFYTEKEKTTNLFIEFGRIRQLILKKVGEDWRCLPQPTPWCCRERSRIGWDRLSPVILSSKETVPLWVACYAIQCGKLSQLIWKSRIGTNFVGVIQRCGTTLVSTIKTETFKFRTGSGPTYHYKIATGTGW